MVLVLMVCSLVTGVPCAYNSNEVVTPEEGVDAMGLHVVVD